MKRKSDFLSTQQINTATYNMYLNRLCDIAISSFNWIDLPSTVDERYLEMLLLTEGKCIFFQDEVLGYIVTSFSDGGNLNIYNQPVKRVANANNGYHNESLDENNSVIIYNDYMHTVIYPTLEMYAWRLYNITRTIDININSQKTPVTILCDEKNKLSLENLYMQYDGNKPVIYGNKNLDLTNIKVLNTGSPMIATQCYDILHKIWNDAMMFLGYTPVSDKRERIITAEAQQTYASTSSNYFSRLSARKQGCKYINDVFGLDVDVNFRQNEVMTLDKEVDSTDE